MHILKRVNENRLKNSIAVSGKISATGILLKWKPTFVLTVVVLKNTSKIPEGSNGSNMKNLNICNYVEFTALSSN